MTENHEQFAKALENLINRYSQENGSDTPDFILAQYLEALLATRPAPPPSAWQPIATAPKDGPYLVWFGNGTPELVAGIAEVNEIRELSLGEASATHWMPLPAPLESIP